mmetsp:Transcript_3840/g.7739  ORF Transcript_3840/g.7739 Transcript_3840/m.7739 type:complete len:212 (-) Transcript_3840:322-957(-)
MMMQNLHLPCPSMWPQRPAELARCGRSLVHHLGNGLPANGEESPLDAVGEDPRAQATAEEPCVALLLNDLLCRVEVADGLHRRLAGRLQHAQGVGAGVRDSGRGKADDGVADVLPKLELEGRQHLAQLVVGVEPRVVAHPSRGHGTNCTLPERCGVLLGLLNEALQAVFALHLLRGLPRIDRHQEDAESSSARGRYHGLRRCWQAGVLKRG